MIEHKYLGKIEARVFQFILDHIECVNFCIFPEINRIEYFKSLVNKEFSYQLFPNTCYVNDDIDLTVPKELSNIPKNHVIIGHVGNLGENHYLDFYIELIEGCKNSFFTFVFIGRYSSNLLKRLKNIDNNNIIIINELPHSELKYFYNFMHYGVILYKGVDLNFEYCAPNKLYEYWSYGISIIAHSLIGLKSLDFSKNMGKLYNLENQLSLVQIKEDLQNNTVNREIVKSEFVEKYDQNLYINTIKTLVEKISMH